MLQRQTLEEVESFTYIGSEICQSSKLDKEVFVRLEKAGTVHQIWRKDFRNWVPQHRLQSMCLSDPGDVCTPLQS